MRFPTYDEAEALKRTWTDKFVRIKPGFPQYERFAGKVGRVVTVNYSGKAIVDFADGAWYGEADMNTGKRTATQFGASIGTAPSTRFSVA